MAQPKESGFPESQVSLTPRFSGVGEDMDDQKLFQQFLSFRNVEETVETVSGQYGAA
jgi:hypothetical protein